MSEKYKFRNPEGTYFVTPTLTGWIDLFTRNIYREILSDSLKYCIHNKGLIIHSWCFMSSHLHLIVSKQSNQMLSEIIRDFKKHTNVELIKAIQSSSESRRDWMLNLFAAEADKIKRVKYFKVWQDGNHPVELNTNKLLDVHLDYIHNNPVEAGWVTKPEHFKWSSAIDYCGEKGIIPIELI